MRFDQGNTPENSVITAAAVRLGVVGGTVYKYLIGTQYPTLSTVRKIESEFGWSISEQARLIPDAGTYDLAYGTVLSEVLREHYPDLEPGLSGTGPVRRGPSVEPNRRASAGGWTQSYIARQLNTAPSAVNRWLTGVRYPETRTMRRIERLFDWPATEQIVLVPEHGNDTAYGTALRAALDRHYPIKS